MTAVSTPSTISAWPRSYLFVPATRPDRLEKARTAGADAIIADLEDAVAPADKDRARGSLAAVLDACRPVMLRINGFGSAWYEKDLELCRHAGVSAVMLPKAEEPAHLQAVHAQCGLPLLALVETARGLWNALAIAQARGVQRLAFGALDFRLDLGLPDAGYEQLGSYRAQLVLASRVAGIAPPVDSPTPTLNDEALIRAEATRARNLGFGAKLCIHPSQVAAVNDAFVPSPQELEWASRVVEAARASGGAAIALDGKMIDRPVLDLAERMLAQNVPSSRASY